MRVDDGHPPAERRHADDDPRNVSLRPHDGFHREEEKEGGEPGARHAGRGSGIGAEQGARIAPDGVGSTFHRGPRARTDRASHGSVPIGVDVYWLVCLFLIGEFVRFRVNGGTHILTVIKDSVGTQVFRMDTEWTTGSREEITERSDGMDPVQA